MVAAENLVVGIAEPQRTEFNLQGCREVPSKVPERRLEGAASTLPYWPLTLVGVTLTENTADSHTFLIMGYSSSHFLCFVRALATSNQPFKDGAP